MNMLSKECTDVIINMGILESCTSSLEDVYIDVTRTVLYFVGKSMSILVP